MNIKNKRPLLLLLVSTGCIETPLQKEMEDIFDVQDTAAETGSDTAVQGEDADEDGFGTLDGDCNDEDASINPEAEELCDGIDNNCDGELDEGVQTIYYADNDGDSFGAPEELTKACSVPEGYVDNSDDCNDNDANISPSAEEQCNGMDNDCDGLEDNDLVQMRFSYESWGFSVEVGEGVGFRHNEADGLDGLGVNGVIDSISDMIYDGHGNLADYTEDQDADGTNDYRESQTHDELGNRTSLEADTDGDGSFDYGEFWEYDTSGNLLRHSIDEDGNGTEESFETYAYDADGNEILNQQDTTGDGNINFQREQFFTNGLLTFAEWDTDMDGTAEYDAVFLYNNDEKLLSYQIIFIESNTTYDDYAATYSDTGILLSSLQLTDTDLDGSFNESNYKEFDELELVARNELDTDYDGDLDRVILRTHDANGHLSHYEDDSDGDGVSDLIYDYIFTESGEILLFEQDSDGDGSPENISEFNYNDQGALLFREDDLDGDGVMEYTSNYLYDDSRNLIGLESDEDGDGVLELSWSISHSCLSQ